MSKQKRFTWKDLKKIVNAIPDNRLKDDVIIWTDRDDDASGFRVKEAFPLEENYVKGEEGCFPQSELKDMKRFDDDFDPKDHPVLHKKGKMIIYAE